MTIIVKPCIKCGASDRNKWGACRPCKKASAAIWHKANLEKMKLVGAEWRKRNPEKIRATTAKWRKANPEKAKLIKARWRKNNPEKAKLAETKWRKANPEKIKLVADIWKKANIGKVRLAHAKWQAKWNKTNPEKRRVLHLNRRSRKQANGGKLSPNLAAVLYKRQKGLCVCCKEPLGKDYHLDHIMPLALGGKNKDYNMQLLRATCNMSKGAKHPIEFMQSRGLLL